MKGFFPSSDSELSPSKNVRKPAKGPKRYAPQKNSVSYALLITLYRQLKNGVSFMKKQELIDAAEASGLARTSIGPDKAKGKPSQFGSSAREWYTGWNCMKTLILKGLVVKSSCPAKYMLTEEGQEAARECLLRSGLIDSCETLTPTDRSQSSLDEQRASMSDFSRVVSTENRVASTSAGLGCEMEINDTDRNDQCDLVDSSDSDSADIVEIDYATTIAACTSSNNGNRTSFGSGASRNQDSVRTDSAMGSFSLRACSSVDPSLQKPSDVHTVEADVNSLAMPPCSFGEKFEDTYDIVLILDDREHFGSRSRKVVDNLHSQFKILVEVRRLPIGDGIWIVRHRQSNHEYVLDFIVERKNVNDLCSSIRDNRYRDQKLRLQRCGLRKLIYLVEGDPNSLETAESIKTACFTTEILEGFDVQRTTGFADTVKRYGYLTQSIFQYYCTYFAREKITSCRVCPLFIEFVKKCQDLEKMTVSDVLALQLMQVPQVTEEIALAVVDLYPTVLSLAKAYSLLEGDVRGQEEMLKNENKTISGAASRNIFKLIWA